MHLMIVYFFELSEDTRFLGKKLGSSILFVCKCYHDLQNVVFNNRINKLRIMGNPGIEKPFSDIIYFIYLHYKMQLLYMMIIMKPNRLSLKKAKEPLLATVTI